MSRAAMAKARARDAAPAQPHAAEPRAAERGAAELRAAERGSASRPTEALNAAGSLGAAAGPGGAAGGPSAAVGGPGAAAAADLFARPFGALVVGDRFATPGRGVTERDILDFAALSGDRHPQHTDPEWAAGSRFGEQIAHGLLVLSFAVGLLPLDPDRVVALRRVGDAVFKQPVKIGDTVHVEGEIVRTREVDPEHGLVEARLRIVNGGGRLVVRADVELVWRA